MCSTLKCYTGADPNVTKCALGGNGVKSKSRKKLWL